jgi:deoxyribodipyrimidine photo-lyase
MAATTPPLIYWFRADLRLTDNPALTAAAQQAQRTGQSLLPVYCRTPAQTTRWGFARVGMHRQRFLRATLDDLARRLHAVGSGLLELTGPAATTLPALAQTLGATDIVCEDLAAPEEQAEIAALRHTGLRVHPHAQSTLMAMQDLPFAPEDVPDVFTAFRQRLRKAQTVPAPPWLRPLHCQRCPVLCRCIFNRISLKPN